MVLRLDPRLPLVWRSPHALQIGYDRPVARLEGLSSRDEYLLAALQRGTSRSGLDVIAETAGGTTRDVDALLQTVAPALETRGRLASLEGHVIVDTGGGAGAESIRSLFSRLGATVLAAVPDSGQAPPVELAVIVQSFVISPAAAGHWLRRDVPHLAVVYGDTEVQIGPLVDPGNGPCLHCADRSRLDRDPAWTAIAGQLLDRVAATEGVLTIADSLPHIARRAIDRLDHACPAARRAELAHTILVLDRDSGALSERRLDPHPDCGCQELPQPGSATAAAPGSGPARSRSKTARAAAARA
jgi:bacteriocin biosynthesis cyclodehydratase domain-containing protein